MITKKHTQGGTRRKAYDRSPEPVYDAPEALDSDTASLAPETYADEYHDADEPYSGAATPTMQSPLAARKSYNVCG